MCKAKYGYEEFLKVVDDNKFKILGGEYVDCVSRFLVESEEGYLANVKAISLIKGRETRFFHPVNEYALQNISLYLKNNNLNFRLVSTEYIKATDELEFECPVHGIFKKTFKLIRKGYCCLMCSRYRPKTKEEIYEKLKSIEWEWIDGEYIDSSSKLTVINVDGYKSVISMASLFQDVVPPIFYDTNPYTIYNIRKFLENTNTNIKLNSEAYIDSRADLEFECEEHGVFISSWTEFKRSGCRKCSGTYIYYLDEVKSMLSEINKNIEIICETRESCDGKRAFKCKCLVDGNVWISSFTDLVTRGCGCRICRYRNNSGENHHYYNHEKTDEEREIRREYGEYYKWREDVYRKDNYTCVCCGYDKGGKLNAHHLDGYSWAKDKRTDLNNGVTLCKDCHEDFHRIYGYRDNTKEQYSEWINKKINNKTNLELVI